MEISQFAFNLLLIFFPGIICAYLVEIFTSHREWTTFRFVLNAFVLGFSSYLLFAGALIFFTDQNIYKMNFVKAIAGRTASGASEADAAFALFEVSVVCVVSVVLAALLIIIINYRYHFIFLQNIRFTRKFAEDDVWSYLMNSLDTPWVTVRDIKNGLVYDGWVQNFSNSARDAELLLEDVIVYDNVSGDFLYRVDVQYLLLDREMISIEFRSVEEERKNVRVS